MEECEMKKIERQSKVRARMTSNTHDSEFTDQTDDRADRTADGVEDASHGDKTVLRKVADTASSSIQSAREKAAASTSVAAKRVKAYGEESLGRNGLVCRSGGGVYAGPAAGQHCQ